MPELDKPPEGRETRTEYGLFLGFAFLMVVFILYSLWAASTAGGT